MDQKKEQKKKSTWGWVFHFAGERKSAYLWSIVLAVLSVICQMIPFFVMADLISGLLEGDRDFSGMLLRCGLMALCWFGRQLFHALSTAQSHKATFYVLGSMRKQALARLSVMSLGDVYALGSGNLKNILVERIDSIETTLAHILPEFTSNILATVLMLVFVFAIDWRMGLFTLITFPVGFVAYMGMMIDYQPSYERTVRATKNLNDAAVEYIGGIEVIKVFGKVRGSYEKFAAAAREGANSYIDWMKKCNVFFALAMTVIPAALVAVLPAGLFFVSKGSLSQADFILIIMLTIAIFEPLMTCMSYSDDLAVLGTVMGQITGIIGAEALERPGEDQEEPKDYTVTFEDVHFGYHEGGEYRKPGQLANTEDTDSREPDQPEKMKGNGSRKAGQLTNSERNGSQKPGQLANTEDTDSRESDQPAGAGTGKDIQGNAETGEKEVLHGITFTMKQGTVNALVGPSGSGKTTIARLLASYWDVDSGSIRIGGADIRKLSLETYHKKIAYVSQDNFLFDDTVMENIRMGNPSATDEEVVEAAKRCGCHDFILGLEHGYQTMAGGAGSHLSGGERQRISIARAMLKNAPILILDEATAYTDPENEAILQESIAKLVVGKTLIVIAHRLSTITDADQILVVNRGRIEDRGTHEELLSRHGLYEQMWKAHISVKDTLKNHIAEENTQKGGGRND